MRCSLIFVFLAAMTAVINGFAFKLHNALSSPIYVWSSNHNGDSSGEELVNPGDTYTAPYTLDKDGEGITIKAAWTASDNPNTQPNYEAEVSKKSGVLWYNFSHEQGAVFHGYPRTLGGGACEVAHCDANSDACDWYAIAGGGDGNIHQCSPIPDELVATIGA